MSTAALPQLGTMPPPADRPPSPPRWLLPAAALLLPAAGSVVCMSAAGPLQGGLFGACATAALLAPPLAAGSSDWRTSLLVAGGLLVGSILGPLIGLLQGNLNGPLFSTLFAVVATLVLALTGVTSLLALLRVPPPLAATLVVLAALLWLGWPVWLSPWLAGNEPVVAALSPAHPLLTLDAAITRQGGVSWLEHRIMYAKLTVLGQHVFTRQPTGVAAAAAWHGGVGAACLLIVTLAGLWSGRRARRLAEDAFDAV